MPTLSAFDGEEISCALVAQPDFQSFAGHREIALDDSHGAVMLPVLAQPLEQKLAFDFLMLLITEFRPQAVARMLPFR